MIRMILLYTVRTYENATYRICEEQLVAFVQEKSVRSTCRKFLESVCASVREGPKVAAAQGKNTV